MVECTWTWPRYLKMQDHWLRWGPPVYIPVAGYFGLGAAGKRGAGGGGKTGEAPPTQQEGRGDLNELLAMFKSGAIQ